MAVPLAPTGITVPSTILYGSGQFTVSWTFNGTGPQTGYQFQWREAGSGTWRSNLLETTSATTSGAFPPNHIANSGFDGASGWESNGMFGTRNSSTFASATTKAHTGTASLEVTWAAGNPVTWVNTFLNTITPGREYDVTAWVWSPSGTAEPYIEIAFYDSSPNAPIPKAQWTQIHLLTRSSATDWFPGVSVFNSRAGEQTWIDDYSILERLAPGDYEMQVRTSNAEGLGPWSATKTFTVEAPIWQRMAGAWVPLPRRVRVGGSWAMAKTRETT